MSKKPKHGRRPGLSLAELETRVRRAMTEGRSQQALELAKQIYKQEATPPYKELLRQAYLERARQLRQQSYLRDAVTVLENALPLSADDPAWQAKLAEELAACGQAQKALQLLERVPESGLRARILNQVADMALFQGTSGRGTLPGSLQPQFDLIVQAFTQSEAGQYDQARQPLQGIGLQSPFLEWKLLLRGLLAFYQNQDDLALENWQRLNPDRLPARLAAPLRFVIDPAYQAAQPPATQSALQRQADRLQTSGLVPLLRQIQSGLGHDTQLPHTFRLAENLLPALQRDAPQLVPRLAACFYWAVITVGQPEDMARYRRVFKAPADDPNLERLQALAYEHAGDLAAAHQHWQHYEAWVAQHPAVWPGDQANRVRALVWARMGRNAASIPDVAQIPDLPPFLRDHPDRPRPLVPSAETCWQRSLELAPDRLEGYEALLRWYGDEQKADQAEQVARRLLERFPGHVPTLETLADLRMQQHDYAEAVTLLQQALKGNPLDRPLRQKLSTAHTFNGRSQAESGHLAEARAEYQAALVLGEGENNSSVLCKWAACEFKANDAARAEELLQQALAAAGSRLAIAYSMLIETIRFGLPGRLKTRFNKDFNAALAEPPTTAAVVAVAETAAAHRLAGVTYHGQKTHEKKVLAYIDKARQVEFGADQLVELCEHLLALKAVRQLRAFAGLGRKRFPRDCRFLLLEADSYMALGPKRCPCWKVQPLLDQARQLAMELPPDDQRKRLLEGIQNREELLSTINPFGAGIFREMFERLFDPEGPWEDDDEDEWVEEDEMPFEELDRPRKKQRGSR